MGDLHEASENYKIQMRFQGQYPKEAALLKQGHDKDVQRIEAEYPSCSSKPSNPPTAMLGMGLPSYGGSTPILFGAVAAVSALCAAMALAIMRFRTPSALSKPLLPA